MERLSCSIPGSIHNVVVHGVGSCLNVTSYKQNTTGRRVELKNGVHPNKNMSSQLSPYKMTGLCQGLKLRIGQLVLPRYGSNSKVLSGVVQVPDHFSSIYLIAGFVMRLDVCSKMFIKLGGEKTFFFNILPIIREN